MRIDYAFVSVPFAFCVLLVRLFVINISVSGNTVIAIGMSGFFCKNRDAVEL